MKAQQTWNVHRPAPAIAENQIQLTAVIMFNNAITTKWNLSGRMNVLGCARERTKAYPTTLVEAIVGD